MRTKKDQNDRTDLPEENLANMQHKKLMLEAIMKHKKMFNSTEESNGISENRSEEIVKKASLVPKTNTIVIAPQKKPLVRENDQSVNLPPAPFNSKILSRNTKPSVKVATTLETVEETDVADSTSAMNFWKKKANIKPKSTAPAAESSTRKADIPNGKLKSTVPMTESSTQKVDISTESVSSITETSSVASEEPSQVQNTEDKPEPEKLSATDLIKTFNTTATLNRNSPTRKFTVNKGTKAKAPVAPVKSSATNSLTNGTASSPTPTMVPVVSANKNPKLVKTQSWKERSGRSVVTITAQDPPSDPYSERFAAEPSASTFKAMFEGGAAKEAPKPLVSIDSYGSSTPGPAKLRQRYSPGQAAPADEE